MMSKVREQNKIAEIAALSDYDIAANNLHLASVFVRAAGQANDEMARYKWLKLARAKMDVAEFYVDDLQDV